MCPAQGRLPWDADSSPAVSKCHLVAMGNRTKEAWVLRGFAPGRQVNPHPVARENLWAKIMTGEGKVGPEEKKNDAKAIAHCQLMPSQSLSNVSFGKTMLVFVAERDTK